MGRCFKNILVLQLVLFIFINSSSQDYSSRIQHNILYINSYAMGYPWTDSLVSGIQDVISQHSDIQVFTEFLDAKRFGKSNFENLFRFYQQKYRNIHFDAVITSDNDALDFMMLYGDSLAPEIPVAFCGINNPQDYKIENSRFYGILDAVDMKNEINLILKIMPRIQKLYFITDKSTTSLLNQSYAQSLEPEYADRIQFEYIHNYSPDSLMKAVRGFEIGSAVALINYYQDNKGNPLNSEAIYLEITRLTNVPIFMDSETMLGKGIAGGIINNGTYHGREVANLALNFIRDPDFKPSVQVILPKGKYYFDYNVLSKYSIDKALLPNSSVVINKPQKIEIEYIKYISALILIIAALIVLILLLFFNIDRRKKAEHLVGQKLAEIQEKNSALGMAHEKVYEMNAELEEINEHLSKTNEELTIAKERSDESDKLKSAFLANISHEIRTPLNAIIGFSSLLSDSRLTKTERDEYLNIMSSSSDQLLRIIDDILDLSKLESGQFNVFIETFYVKEVLAEAVNSFSSQIMHNPVQIRLSVKDENYTLQMESDRTRFKQILGNLLSNSVKFTRKGSIEVGYHFNTPKEITFFVRDTGIGIDKRDLKNIFNRFWKADLNGEKFYSGAGLGLAISKKLCEALGGRIWVESEQGKGTTVFLAFQEYVIKKTEKQSELKTLTLQNDLTFDGFTIAIAEDERHNLHLLTRILQKLNVKLLTFRTGAEIVKYFKNNNYERVDLILMDIRMPDMDGIMATKLIREINPDIPVIAQTAYTMAEEMEKIKSSTFDDFISKPIKPVILIEKIKRYLYPKAG